MKKIILIFFITLFISCNVNSKKESTTSKLSTIDNIIEKLSDSKSEKITVVAHRGDWRNAPENSLQAIQNCIDMGVDMVEIDIRETKDGQLVLMHDTTIDRTTKGTGKVSDLTCVELKKFYLVDALGHETPHKIPTLEEALRLAKNKILINLDKSYPIFDKCYEVAKKVGVLNQIVIKGNKNYEEVKKDFGEYLKEVFYMPIINLSNPNAEQMINDFITNLKPVAIEFVFDDDSNILINKFEDIQDKGVSIWVNSLWGFLCGGNDDEKAVLNPSIYDWYIKHKVNIIQTDRPEFLIKYLKNKKLH